MGVRRFWRLAWLSLPWLRCEEAGTADFAS